MLPISRITTKQRHAALAGEQHNIVIPKLYLEWVDWDYPVAIVLRSIVGWCAWAEQQGKAEIWRTGADWQRDLRLSPRTVNRALDVINRATVRWLGEPGELVHKRISYGQLSDGTLLSTRATYYSIDDDLFGRIYDAVLVGREAKPVASETVDLAASATVDPAAPETPDRAVSSTVNNRQHKTADLPPVGDDESSRSEPVPSGKPVDPAKALVIAFCEAVELDTIASWPKAMRQAKQLHAASVTPDQMPAIVGWLRDQAWIAGGIDLGLILSQLDRWRVATNSGATHGARRLPYNHPRSGRLVF